MRGERAERARGAEQSEEEEEEVEEEERVKRQRGRGRRGLERNPAWESETRGWSRTAMPAAKLREINTEDPSQPTPPPGGTC
jgi:hypothetical protein